MKTNDPGRLESSAHEDQTVVIAKTSRSVLYHDPECGRVIDERGAAELARADAERLGYRAHDCIADTQEGSA